MIFWTVRDFCVSPETPFGGVSVESSVAYSRSSCELRSTPLQGACRLRKLGRAIDIQFTDMDKRFKVRRSTSATIRMSPCFPDARRASLPEELIRQPYMIERALRCDCGLSGNDDYPRGVFKPGSGKTVTGMREADLIC